MSTAREVLNQARRCGVEVEVKEGRMRMRAAQKPPDSLLAALRHHKPEIVALLSLAETGGTGAAASEAGIAQWLLRNPPEPTDPDRCAWCTGPAAMQGIVVPFGTQGHGPVWLHPSCWRPWFTKRRADAAAALAIASGRATTTGTGG